MSTPLKFLDYNTEIPLNELLRNFDANSEAWLNGTNLPNKEKRQLKEALDLIKTELQNGQLTGRDQVRNFTLMNGYTPDVSIARQKALGFLSNLLDSRPKINPEEPPVYSNNHLKQSFHNQWGDSSQPGVINLGAWEAQDYDENENTFTGQANRFTQMKDFLSGYKTNLGTNYTFDATSRYTDLNDLNTRLDNAINALGSTQINWDDVHQSLAKLGWNSNDIDQLFRTSIPIVEDKVEEPEDVEDPLVTTQKELQQTQLALQLEQYQQYIDNLIAQRDQANQENVWNQEFGVYWVNTYVNPYKETEPIVDLTDFVNQGTYDLGTQPDYDQLSVDIQTKLIDNGKLEDPQDIYTLLQIYKKAYEANPSNFKKVITPTGSATSEVYLDAFVRNGMFYSYDPNSNKLYLRRVRDNKTIFDELQNAYLQRKKAENDPYDAIFYDPSKIATNKLGGVLKLQFGNNIHKIDFGTTTPAPENPENPENQEITSAAVFDVSNWTARDWNIAAQILLDLGSIPVGYAGPYGWLGAAGMGLASTALNAVNNYNDDKKFDLEDLGTLGMNLGADVVGLLPAWGDASAFGKATKAITSSLAITQLLMSIPGGAQLIDKINKGEQITVEDAHFLSGIFGSLYGLSAQHANSRQRSTLNSLNNVPDYAKAPRNYNIYKDPLGRRGRGKNTPLINWHKQVLEGSGSVFGSGTSKVKGVFYDPVNKKWVDANGVEVAVFNRKKPQDPRIDSNDSSGVRPSADGADGADDLGTPSRTSRVQESDDVIPAANDSEIQAIPNESEIEVIVADPPVDNSSSTNQNPTQTSNSNKKKSGNKKSGNKKNKKNKREDGGILLQLKELRQGGIIKALFGTKVDPSFKTFTDLVYKQNPGAILIKDNNSAMDGDQPYKISDLIKDLKDGAIDENNYKTDQRSLPFYNQMVTYAQQTALNTQPEQFRRQSMLPELGRYLNTAEFNAQQTKQGIQSIRDNIVLPNANEYFGYNISNNLANTLGFDEVASNITNKIANNLSSDMNANRAFMNAGYVESAAVDLQKQQYLANSYEQSKNLMLQQDKENQMSRNQMALDRATALASASKAMDDIQMAGDLKNHTAEDLYAQNLIKSQYDEINKHNEVILSNLSDINKQAMLQELAQIQAKATAEGRPVSEEERLSIQSKYAEIARKQLGQFYGIKQPDIFEGFQYTIQQKQGGKLDKNIQISKQLEKRYLEQLKRTDKQLDRLSKVTYKAILKSLGLK